MIEEKFAVAHLGVAPPCYVRMVDKASDCGMKEDSPKARSQMIHDRLLAPGEDGAVSLWLVRDALDLARVALALNSTRVSLTAEILFFAIEPSRLQDHELQCTEGRVDCVWAKRQHRDLTLGSERRKELSQAFAETERRGKRFSESKMKISVERAREDRCYSVVNSELADPPCACIASDDPRLKER